MHIDLKNNLEVVNTIAPATRNSNVTGDSVDLQGFHGAMIEAIVGTVTDGTHSLTIEESDDNSNWSEVAATDLDGSFADLESETNQAVGYLGNKRYIRVNATSSGTTGAAFAVVVVKGHPRKAPA